ncbi:MAG: heme exporter protein CcmD [Proteobacteria bacterium]|nr:MAG: heme exporter protein CcmD [Pseudomonadota bacterium]
MEYVIAAYALSLGPVALYLAHLVRERRRLLRDLDDTRVRPG